MKNKIDKYNINLLDIIENKDLFQNLKINNNLANSKIINKNINTPFLSDNNEQPNENKTDIKSEINNEQNKENNIEEYYLIDEEKFNDDKDDNKDDNIEKNEDKGDQDYYNFNDNNNDLPINNNNNEINCISFQDFMKKKNKEFNQSQNTPSITYSTSKNKKKSNNKNKIKKKETNKTMSKTFSNMKNNKSMSIYKNRNNFSYTKYKNNKTETNNMTEEKVEKKKYSKERIEMNKQRLDKLYKDYQKFQNKINNRRKELSEDEIKNCSFSPKINKYSEFLVENNPQYIKPIYLRKENKKDFYKKKHEIIFTHVPKINKNYNLDQYKRLYNKNMNKNDNEESQCEYPFKPITNYNFECNNNIKNLGNLEKRQILLDEYINQNKIIINNNNKNAQNEEFNKLSFTPNTSCTSNSKYSINPKMIKIFGPCYNEINMMHKTQNNKNKRKKINQRNYSFNNINDYNLYKNKQTEISVNNKNYKSTEKTKRNKSAKNSNSFLFDYMSNINKRMIQQNNLYNPGFIHFKTNQNFYRNNNSKHKNAKNKENVITSFKNKIDLDNYNSQNTGICIDITKNCNNLKQIINRTRYKSYE